MFPIQRYGNPPKIPFRYKATLIVGMMGSWVLIGYIMRLTDPEPLEDPAFKSPLVSSSTIPSISSSTPIPSSYATSTHTTSPSSSSSSSSSSTNFIQNLTLEECLVLYEEAQKRYIQHSQSRDELIQRLKDLQSRLNSTNTIST